MALRGEPSRLLAIARAIVAAALIAGCASQPSQVVVEADEPAGFPHRDYRLAIERGEPVFAIAADSLVVLEVRRAGRLARLGHDHVVAAHDVRGFIAPDEGRADLFVRLERLVVDEQDLRTEAGFGERPPESAVNGTRNNMLGPVLHAAEHPFAVVHVAKANPDGDLDVAITLNGVTHASRVHAVVDRGADTMSIAGRFAVDQTDFGITPLSIFGGAIQVANRVDVRFAIRARNTLRECATADRNRRADSSCPASDRSMQ
jgi:hypothetical protein